MNERITIEEFINVVPLIKDHTTTIMHNILCILKSGEYRFYKITFPKLEYIDEVTEEIYLKVKGAGKKSWAKFCKLRDNYSTIKEYVTLINS